MEKIFLVEDDLLIANLYKKAFSLSGYEVETAFDGKDALEKLKTINPLPDIILLDIMMPIMNGLDTLKEIKQNPEFDAFKNIPVITLTNLVSKEDIEKSLALGAIINLIKSEHEPKEIVKKVKEVIDSQKNKEI